MAEQVPPKKLREAKVIRVKTEAKIVFGCLIRNYSVLQVLFVCTVVKDFYTVFPLPVFIDLVNKVFLLRIITTISQRDNKLLGVLFLSN